jgi:putative endonuclease
MFYVYILKKPRSELIYIGYSADLQKRIKAHTGREQPDWELVYYEAYLNEQDARDRERQMKDYGNARTYLKKRIKRCITEDLEGAGRSVEPKSP